MNTELPGFLSQYDPTWLAGVGIASALLVSLLILIIYKFRHPSNDKKVEKAIKEIGEDYIKDIVLSDGMYGYHFIDYIVLLPGKIMVVALQHFEGYIFGGEKIEKWAQVVNNRSYNFDNPVILVSHCVQAIKDIAHDADVTGNVVFASNCSFPKGVPPGVIELDQFRKELERLKNDTPTDDTLKEVWGKILETSKRHKLQYQEELRAA
jgi:hypothetical protein